MIGQSRARPGSQQYRACYPTVAAALIFFRPLPDLPLREITPPLSAGQVFGCSP